jgi:hypothetical protein
MGLFLHPGHPGGAPLYVAGQRLVDGLVGGEHLREYERVLDRHRALAMFGELAWAASPTSTTR